MSPRFLVHKVLEARHIWTLLLCENGSILTPNTKQGFIYKPWRSSCSLGMRSSRSKEAKPLFVCFDWTVLWRTRSYLFACRPDYSDRDPSMNGELRLTCKLWSLNVWRFTCPLSGSLVCDSMQKFSDSGYLQQVFLWCHCCITSSPLRTLNRTASGSIFSYQSFLQMYPQILSSRPPPVEDLSSYKVLQLDSSFRRFSSWTSAFTSHLSSSPG